MSDVNGFHAIEHKFFSGRHAHVDRFRRFIKGVAAEGIPGSAEAEHAAFLIINAGWDRRSFSDLHGALLLTLWRAWRTETSGLALFVQLDGEG